MPKEYIEREALIENIKKYKVAIVFKDGIVSKNEVESAMLRQGEQVRKAIEQTPTADVVEVVRCKDCEKWNEKSGLCSRYSHNVENVKLLQYTRPTDFCSYGVRKEL